MVTNEMDTYLSRMFKNWAAGQNPPEGGREDLLRRAAAQQVQAHLSDGHWPFRMEVWEERPSYRHLHPSQPPNGWAMQPFAPSVVMTFDFTLLHRQIA